MKKILCILCTALLISASFGGCDFLTDSLLTPTPTPGPAGSDGPATEEVPVVTSHPNFNTNGAVTAVSGMEDICSRLKIQYFTLPQEAENPVFSIIDGSIGNVNFTYKGVDMYYRTAKTTTADLSGLGRDLSNHMTATIDVGVPANNATVIFYAFNDGAERIARWKFGDTQYCLVCTNGMRESVFAEVAEELGQSTSPEMQQQQ